MIKGIDINNNNSYRQAISEIERSENDFIWIKLTEGKTYLDKDAEGYVSTARLFNKIVGLYHFARPDNNSPYEEAEWFCKNIEPYFSKGLMLALDWEKGIKGASSDWIAQWMGRVQNILGLGYPPIIYLSYFDYQKWKHDIPKSCGLWIAWWGEETSNVLKEVDRLVAFHQYGIVNGIDRNIFNGDLNQCKKYMFHPLVDVEETEGELVNWNEYRDGFVDYLLGKDTFYEVGENILMHEGRPYKAYVTKVDTIESFSSIYQILTVKGIMPYGDSDS